MKDPKLKKILALRKRERKKVLHELRRDPHLAWSCGLGRDYQLVWSYGQLVDARTLVVARGALELLKPGSNWQVERLM